MRAWRAQPYAAADIASAGEAIANRGLDFLAPLLPGHDRQSASPHCPMSCASGRCCGASLPTVCVLALPVCKARALPLHSAPGSRATRWTRPYGASLEPKADKPELAPDIVLVPLLAFDRQGWRLGYGGGFYDRTLADLRARKKVTAVGLGYRPAASRRRAASRL